MKTENEIVNILMNEKEIGLQPENGIPIITNVEKVPTMFDALMSIQKELKTISKDKKGYSGKFASIENVWESIRNIINANGFVVLHSSTFKDGRFGVETEAMHTSGNSIKSFIPFIEWDVRSTDKKTEFRDAQDQGKELTYYKRYNLTLIFNLVIAEEDNDANKKLGNYQKKQVNGELAAKKLIDAETYDLAKSIYKSLSPEERQTDEVLKANMFLREKFSV